MFKSQRTGFQNVLCVINAALVVTKHKTTVKRVNNGHHSVDAETEAVAPVLRVLKCFNCHLLHRAERGRAQNQDKGHKSNISWGDLPVIQAQFSHDQVA